MDNRADSMWIKVNLQFHENQLDYGRLNAKKTTAMCRAMPMPSVPNDACVLAMKPHTANAHFPV